MEDFCTASVYCKGLEYTVHRHKEVEFLMVKFLDRILKIVLHLEDWFGFSLIEIHARWKKIFARYSQQTIKQVAIMKFYALLLIDEID